MNDSPKVFWSYTKAAEDWLDGGVGKLVPRDRESLAFDRQDVALGAALRSMHLLERIAKSLEEIAYYSKLTDQQKLVVQEDIARSKRETKRNEELLERHRREQFRFAKAYTCELGRYLERKHGKEVGQFFRQQRLGKHSYWFNEVAGCVRAKQRHIHLNRNADRKTRRARRRQTKLKLREEIEAFQFEDIINWYGIGKVKLKKLAERFAPHWDEAAQYLRDS